MTVDPSSGEVVPTGKSPRFLLWVSFFACKSYNVLCLLSLNSRLSASYSIGEGLAIHAPLTPHSLISLCGKNVLIYCLFAFIFSLNLDCFICRHLCDPIVATITMGSAVSVKKSESQANAKTRNAEWAVFCSAFSFTVTGIVSLMHMSPMFSGYIIGTKLEGIITILLAAFWAATVSVGTLFVCTVTRRIIPFSRPSHFFLCINSDTVANAATGLAVDSDKDNTIVNGNLYYFSWAGFVTSILLVVSYLRGVFGVDVYGEVKNRAARLTLWAGFLACQLVVMGASSNILDKDCSSYDSSSSYCRRTKFGISVGAIGTSFCLCVVAMKMLTTVAPFVVEGVLALFLCILNGFGVAFLTSAEGPGSPIGNLYYFSWLSWFCSFMLIAGVYNDYQGGNTSGNQENDHNKTDGEVPIETLGEEDV